MTTDTTALATNEKNGSYRFRFHLDPDFLLRLFKLPDGFSVRWVLFNDERGSWDVIVDAPEEPQFFVPLTAILPVQGAAITVVHGEEGDYLKVELPQVKETVHA